MTTMDCGAARDLLPDRVHGNLAREQDERLEVHLAGCEACREELAFVSLVGASRAEPPASLLARIQAAVAAERAGAGGSTVGQPRRRAVLGLLRQRPGWAAAAAAVVLLGTSVLLRNDERAWDEEVWLAFFDGTAPVWLSGDGVVAGAPVLEDLSGLSEDALVSLLEELEG